MADNIETTENENLEEVITSVDAWIEDGSETGSSAVLCVRTTIYGSDGLVGYGIQGTSGYIGNGREESDIVGSGVLNGTETVVDGTHQWTVPKTHDGWTATCYAKSEGVVIGDNEAYPASDPETGYVGYVECDVVIPATTSYVVTYNANSTDAEGVPEQQVKWHDEPLTLSTDKPTRTGYTFVGWASSISATKSEYAAGTSYIGNENINLYAVWEINTWAVKYDANGGNEDSMPGNQTKVYNETLKLSETIPTRDKYIFIGWGTSATDTTVDYNAGDDYTKNAAVTLYAIWAKTYDVVYNANGGIDAPEAQVKVSNITLSLSTSEPTKDNCDFVGWSTAPDGGVEYYSGSDYVRDIDVTLYAVWKNTDSIMKTLNSNEVYDAAARDSIYGVRTSGTGDAYVASVNGIDSLDVGVSITIIPHTTSTSSSPTLIVNGLLDNKGKAPRIRCRVSGNTASTTASAGLDDNWIAANKPIKVVYDGIGWITDMTIPNANRLNGIVPIESGGTAADSAGGARINLGLSGVESDGTGALSIENGGTGANIAFEALNNLGITWGTDEAPATGTPNSIYIQIN